MSDRSEGNGSMGEKSIGQPNFHDPTTHHCLKWIELRKLLWVKWDRDRKGLWRPAKQFHVIQPNRKAPCPKDRTNGCGCGDHVRIARRTSILGLGQAKEYPMTGKASSPEEPITGEFFSALLWDCRATHSRADFEQEKLDRSPMSGSTARQRSIHTEICTEGGLRGVHKAFEPSKPVLW